MDSDNITIPLLPLKDFLSCPVCMCELTNTYITPCGHRYCEKCIKECVDRRHKCPCCNAVLQNSQLIKDAGYDSLIATINREKRKAEDTRLINLFINSATDVQKFKPKSKTKICRKRWTALELKIFSENLSSYIERKSYPPTHILDTVVNKMCNTRTVAQVRTRVHNVINAKQKMYNENWSHQGYH